MVLVTTLHRVKRVGAVAGARQHLHQQALLRAAQRLHRVVAQLFLRFAVRRPASGRVRAYRCRPGRAAPCPLAGTAPASCRPDAAPTPRRTGRSPPLRSRRPRFQAWVNGPAAPVASASALAGISCLPACPAGRTGAQFFHAAAPRWAGPGTDSTPSSTALNSTRVRASTLIDTARGTFSASASSAAKIGARCSADQDWPQALTTSASSICVRRPGRGSSAGRSG
jgi:hypothetical protein